MANPNNSILSVGEECQRSDELCALIQQASENGENNLKESVPLQLCFKRHLFLLCTSRTISSHMIGTKHHHAVKNRSHNKKYENLLKESLVSL